MHPHELERERSSSAQRALMVGVLPAGDDLTELAELLRTADVEVLGQLVQHRDEAHPNTYVGPGKLDEVRATARELGADVIVCDDELTPRQERNLEGTLGMPVVDRTAVILDIFAAHASTSEGKLQVELAQLQYNLARMRGLWTHLERLGNAAGSAGPGVGTRGPGETQIETDRRLARDRITKLRRRLARVKATRSTMRAERGRSEHLPNVALAGYTNAGKSTIMGALTDADVGVRDALFHTLDPTTRTYRHDGRTYLLTDTVGFIRKLPHQLVDAFGATLEETREADLVLHVVDASLPVELLEEVMASVHQTLQEIGAGEQPRLIVANKVDRLDAAGRHLLELRLPGAAFVSGTTGEGLAELGDRIAAAFDQRLVAVELLVPYGDGATVAELHRLAGDLERSDEADGVRVRVRLPRELVARYAAYRTAEGVAAAMLEAVDDAARGATGEAAAPVEEGTGPAGTGVTERRPADGSPASTDRRVRAA